MVAAAAAAAAAAGAPVVLFAVGAVTNLAAKPVSLSPEKTWLRRGGFIGVLNGRANGTNTAIAPPVATPPETAPATPGTGASRKKIHPIGGRTDKPPPPTPLSRFPRHKGTKLPGPPRPYDPNNSP